MHQQMQCNNRAPCKFTSIHQRKGVAMVQWLACLLPTLCSCIHFPIEVNLNSTQEPNLGTRIGPRF